MLAAGVGLLQFRDKHAGAKELLGRLLVMAIPAQQLPVRQQKPTEFS